MYTVPYAITTKSVQEFPQTLEQVTSELAKEGFGILTRIDVKETMKKKLDVDFGNYIILGACNPPFAHQVLTKEKMIGLLLPCNIIVFEQDGETVVAAINPLNAMSIAENDELLPIAQEVTAKLIRVVQSIR